MSQITLQAELRSETGSGPAGRLRAEGKLPGVVYGKGAEPVHVVLDHHELRLAFPTMASRANEVALVVAGATHAVKVHEIQRDPVKGVAIHVDFVRV
jgi:large subunit ribosomal protein L25